MADLVSIVVEPIIKAVVAYVASIIREKYELLQDLEQDIEILSSKLTAIQSVLEDAEDKQLNNRQMRDWLGKLKEVALDAEDVLKILSTDALQWKKNQQVWNLPPSSLISTGRLFSRKLDCANEIKKILERLVDIGKEKDQFHLHVHSATNNITRSGSSSRHTTGPILVESDFVGRKDDKDKIVEMVLEEGDDLGGGPISVIPIIGMGGLGKTTLAQAVFNDPRVFIKGSTQNPFASRMWVSVTSNFNYRRILKEMIQFHSVMKYDINTLSDHQLESSLLDFLTGQRFLLVLDDVWSQSYVHWEKLEKLLKHGRRGSKVLITSRNAGVSDVMGTVGPYFLGSLTEAECWSLFENIVLKQLHVADNNVRAKLDVVGKKIVSKCKGLPLAVKAMGGLLRGNTSISKWEQIERHGIWRAEELNSNSGRPVVLPALKLSYDNLSPPLKQCFGYCYVFPKGYVFDKSELVKLWKAESFIPPREGDTIDEVGEDYFDELLMRSFFQLHKVDEEARFRMHDLIHDLAQSVSRPYCCQVKDKDSDSCRIDEKSRYVSLLCRDVDGPALDIIAKFKRLRTLLLPSEEHGAFGESLGTMLQNLKYLRVLDLSCSSLIEWPSSVEGLILLQYLDLSKNDIRELPNSMCSLLNLQTLKLLECRWLFKLPKDLRNLVNLEHLELDEMFWFKASTLPPSMGSLTSLQNLHAFHVSDESGYRISELNDMNCLTRTLHISKLEYAVTAADANLKDKKGLQKLVFEWSRISGDSGLRDEAAEERVLEDLQPHSNLQQLQIVCYRGTNLPSWTRDGSLPNLVKLSLKQCSNCRVLSLGTMQSLRELEVKGMLELEEWTDEHCPSLQIVSISNCPKLIKLPSSFAALKILKIKRCGLLKTLPFTPSVMFLILVDNILLEDWNEAIVLHITSMNAQGEAECEMVPSFIEVLELKIINCPKLQTLPQVFAPQKLEISGCRLLSTLPPPQRSRRLQHMALDGCEGEALIRAIPDTSSMYSLVISNISGLTCLPKLPNLSGLKALHIRDCADLVSLFEDESSFQGLPSLQSLLIWNNSQLVTLPPQGLPTSIEFLSIGACSSLQSLGANETLKNLTALKHLQLNGCTAVESLPEEGLPASLKHFRIQGCPLLSKQCEMDNGADWVKIKDVPDLEIEYLVEKPKTEASSSNPWYHGFICCKGTVTKELEQEQ